MFLSRHQVHLEKGWNKAWILKPSQNLDSFEKYPQARSPEEHSGLRSDLSDQSIKILSTAHWETLRFARYIADTFCVCLKRPSERSTMSTGPPPCVPRAKCEGGRKHDPKNRTKQGSYARIEIFCGRATFGTSGPLVYSHTETRSWNTANRRKPACTVWTICGARLPTGQLS